MHPHPAEGQRGRKRERGMGGRGRGGWGEEGEGGGGKREVGGRGRVSATTWLHCLCDSPWRSRSVAHSDRQCHSSPPGGRYSHDTTRTRCWLLLFLTCSCSAVSIVSPVMSSILWSMRVTYPSGSSSALSQPLWKIGGGGGGGDTH